MMRLLLTTTLLGLTALSSTAFGAMQPGLYDISMQIVIRNMALELPVVTFRQCLSAKDIAEGKAFATSNNTQDCRISNLRYSGNAVRYDFNCAIEGGRTVIGQAAGTRHLAGYDTLMSGRFVPAIEGLSEINQRMRATRVGMCN
ncbi:MAG: DUF3617 family protein [Thiobacillus sp.]